jgi:hypothetical protein
MMMKPWRESSTAFRQDVTLASARHSAVWVVVVKRRNRRRPPPIYEVQSIAKFARSFHRFCHTLRRNLADVSKRLSQKSLVASVAPIPQDFFPGSGDTVPVL